MLSKLYSVQVPIKQDNAERTSALRRWSALKGGVMEKWIQQSSKAQSWTTFVPTCSKLRSLAHFKLTKNSRLHKEIQSAPVLHSLGCMYLLALDYRRVFNLMISISQILILNDIRIPPSPYSSTNPISVELLVLLKFAHLHSFGQIKKPHLKADGKPTVNVLVLAWLNLKWEQWEQCAGCSLVEHFLSWHKFEKRLCIPIVSTFWCIF